MNSSAALKLLRAAQAAREKKRRASAVAAKAPLSTRAWALKYVPHYVPLEPSRMHEWMYQRIDDYHSHRGRKTAAIAARESAKTTIATKIHTLRNICYGLEPYIMLVSDTPEQSQLNLEAIRDELTENPRIAADFPWAFGRGPKWAMGRIITRNGVMVEAIGGGQKVRGRGRRQHRPSLVIIDDLDDEDTLASEKMRDKRWQWVLKTIFPIGTAETNWFAVGTAFHRKDSMQRLAATPGWDVWTFPAIVEWPDRMDLWDEWERLKLAYTLAHNADPEADIEDESVALHEAHREEMEAGAVLQWPARDRLESLMLMRASIGPAAFDAEKQGKPTSHENSEWKDECFPNSIWFDRWPDLRARVAACDPSKGKRDTSDYSAWVMLGLGHDGYLYCDADLKRRDVERICHDGINLCQSFGAQLIGIEENSFEGLILSWSLIVEQMPGVLLPPPQPILNMANKLVRIRRLSPYITSRRIRFKSHSPGAELLVEQLREFPHGRHDDGCFVAGTMIETESGAKPIETITVGERVLTRSGYRKVKAAGFTGVHAVSTITCADGRQLTGTLNHPLMVNGRWTALGAVFAGDTISAWDGQSALNQNPSSTRASSFDDTQRRNNGHIAGITGRMVDMFAKVLARCTKRFGKTITVQFQRGSSFITRMRTRSTTPLKTWSWFGNLSTRCITTQSVAADSRRHIGSNSMPHEKRPVSGTAPKRASNGTAKPANEGGRSENLSQQPARTADGSTKRTSLIASLPTVQPLAGKRTTPSNSDGRSRPPAKCAPSSSRRRTSTSPPGLAALNVATCSLAGKAAVYNLSVEGDAEYFANGILVHNCDALEMSLRLLNHLLSAPRQPDEGFETERAGV